MVGESGVSRSCRHQRRDVRDVLSRHVLALGPDETMPLSSRMVGGLSLLSWFAVLFFGRMLAFVGGTD